MNYIELIEDTERELQRVIQLLNSPLSKEERNSLECEQIQLEYNLAVYDTYSNWNAIICI